MTPTPQTQSATRLNRLSAGATKHSAELQNLLLPNGTGPGSRTQGRTSTALTVATDDRPETTAGSKLSPARHPVPGDGRGPKLQTVGFMAVPFFNVGIIHLRVLPAPPDLFPPFTPAGKIQPQSQKMPRITRPQVYRVVREMLPRERFGPTELLRWLKDTQDSNERAKRSHAKRRAAMRASPHIPP